MPGIEESPLIVTCLLDSQSQHFFQNLRDQYFPRERNVVPAHVSLFHNLPTIERAKVESALEKVSKRAPFNANVLAPRLMGNGVMFALESAELNELHADLVSPFEQWLIPQDRQKFKPHVVVQNKVAADTAKQTLIKIEKNFESFISSAIGLCLWTYIGGPWRFEKQFLFADDVVKLQE